MNLLRAIEKNSLIRPGIALLIALTTLMPAVTPVQALPPETSYAGTDSGLTGDDVVGGPYDIGFSFTYYGNTYTQFQLTTNGLLCFNGGATGAYAESAIPSVGTPNNCIYAFWDDLYSYNINTQPLLYRTIGDPGSRELIAQWTNYGYFNSTLPMGTFQIILYEGSNQIRMQYRQLLTAERSLGQSAGIGVENATGTVGVQYSLDTASLTPEQSILWTWNGVNNYTYNAGAAYEGVYLYKDNPPPGVPNLVSPGNGAAGVSTSPTFTWEAATGATTYSIRVSVNSNLSSPIISADGLTGLSYAGSGLSVGPTYYWGVQAHNAYGDTWSTIWHFTTAAGNSAPTDITLSNDTIASGQPINTVVGTLTTTDPDVGNTFTYSLVAGAGSGDNASFNISGASLRTSAVLAGGSYGVRIRSTDQGGLYVDEAFTITVTSSNSAPTNITLSNASVAENQPVNTVVGAFTTTDPDAGDTFTYTLVAGAGDTGNGSFNISGNSLRTSAAFDFESQNSYSIRVRSTDAGGLWVERNFTITVTNVNETPTAIALSNASVAENQPINTVVGALSTTDPDSGNTFTYTLVPGLGDNGNGSFIISGSDLRTIVGFDYEAQNTYSIRVRTTDQGGLWTEQAFTITVTNVNETPTVIALSNASVAENVASNTVVGALSSTDPDSGNTFTYTFVAGAGDTGNSSFIISGSNLQTAVVFDHEVQNTYSIRVRTTDQGGLWTEQVFTISVTDAVENTTTTFNSIIPDPTFVGQSYTVSVTVAPSLGAGTPTGTVSVNDGTGATCNITLAGGSGSCDLTSTTSGAKTVTASYGGDPSWNTSSRTAGHTVNQYTPTVTITSDAPDPSYVGQTYTVAATVSGGGPTPTGTIAVNDGHGVTCTITLSGGSGTCDLASMVAGSTTLTGTYSGDTYYSGGSDTEAHQVNYYTPTVTITSDVPDPSVTGQSYLIAVTVSGGGPTPTGTVDLGDGNGGTCGITLAAGSGSCSLTSTVSGAMTLTAIYSGDTYYEPGSDTAGHQVNRADTTLTILSDNDDPSGPGQNFTVAWSVVVESPGAGTPTGDVTVTDDLEAVSCSAAVAAGSCDLSLSTDGAHVLTATYAGDDDFNTSFDTESHFLDASGPQVINVDSVVATGGGSLEEDEVTNALITQITVEFDEDVLDPAGNDGAHDVTNPANYQLRLNGTTNIVINSVTYTNGNGIYIATLDVNDGNYLLEGNYILTAYSGGLQDLLGNDLEGSSEPGTDFNRSFVIDHTGPQVTAIMVNGRVLTSPAWAFLNTREMVIEFDEEVFDPGGSFGQDDITNPNNFLMVMAGSDHVFNTLSCDTGRAGDDVEFFIDQVTYDPETLQATLHFYTDFINGNYHLFICGTTSIVDLVGNPLNSMIDLGNPAADFLLDISFRAAGALPATGFAPGRVTTLPAQTQEYTVMDGLTLEIPSFGRSMPILEVPFTASGWDLTWLWNQAGLLEGTALPTWEGNSVLTGHIYLSNGQPGPFYGLTGLHWGDEIIIHAWGQDYVYSVRSVRQISPTAFNQVLTHETQSWISLLTCQGYNQTSGTYAYRTLVRAVLIEVR